jgi:hypothetical protein
MKEFELGVFKPALFIEVRNIFNDQWENLDIVKSASPEDRVKFINSRFATYPEKQLSGVPFPDIMSYNNLPRQIVFGISVTY